MTDLQTWLDKGKALADQATQGPWEAFEDSDQHLAGCPPTIENLVYAGAVETPIIDWGNGSTKEDAEFIADARTRLPLALDALQAVIEIHTPIDALNVRYRGGRLQQVCTGCGTDDGNWNHWPCPTVRAITDAIGGGDE